MLKLYDSLVWPIIDYGFCLWAQTVKKNKACRYFMEVVKYTPNIAVQGDMEWLPTEVKIWKSMGKCSSRFKDMDNNRLNKRTFNWFI